MRMVRILAAGGLVLGACAQPAPAPTVVAVDSAAVRTGLDSLRARYERAETAGDAAAVAAIYTETGAIDLMGAPPLRGRAGILEGVKATYAANKPEVLHISVTNTDVRSNESATEIGTYHQAMMVAGKRTQAWGRWVSAGVKTASGEWQLTYLMAFPDSTKTDK